MVFETKNRDYSFDNIRFLLMFCVVFAHLLENAVSFPGSRLLYDVIYSFHMPAFLFLFGYFAKYSRRRIVQLWIIPYLIFQTLYVLFCRFVLQIDNPLQYTRPYWILWYLLVCIYYQILIPVYDLPRKRGQIAVLICACVLCLLAGYVDFIGYSLSLSRFLVFQPWFILGYYCRKNQILDRLAARPAKQKRLAGIPLIAGVVLAVCFLAVRKLPKGLLYGAYSYSRSDSTVWMRLMTVLIAFLFIAVIFLLLRPLVAKKLPLITQIGQHTLPIFLMHGFIVKAIAAYCPQLLSTPWWLLLLSCAVMVLFGNQFAQRFIDLITLRWLWKKN